MFFKFMNWNPWISCYNWCMCILDYDLTSIELKFLKLVILVWLVILVTRLSLDPFLLQLSVIQWLSYRTILAMPLSFKNLFFNVFDRGVPLCQGRHHWVPPSSPLSRSKFNTIFFILKIKKIIFLQKNVEDYSQNQS